MTFQVELKNGMHVKVEARNPSSAMYRTMVQGMKPVRATPYVHSRARPRHGEYEGWSDLAGSSGRKRVIRTPEE